MVVEVPFFELHQLFDDRDYCAIHDGQYEGWSNDSYLMKSIFQPLLRYFGFFVLEPLDQLFRIGIGYHNHPARQENSDRANQNEEKSPNIKLIPLLLLPTLYQIHQLLLPNVPLNPIHYADNSILFIILRLDIPIPSVEHTLAHNHGRSYVAFIADFEEIDFIFYKDYR